MKKLLSLLFVICSMQAMAQAPYIQWQKCLGGTAFEISQTVLQLADSNYIIFGKTSSADGDVTTNNGLYDCWLAKLSPTGALLWQKSYGGTLQDNGNYIQQTADGGFIFAATSRSNDIDVSGNHGSYDFWIVKLSATGAITWQQSFGGSGQDLVHCVKQTADGGYIAVGSSNSTDGDVTGNHGGEDVWAIKLSPTGSLVWQKSYGGTDEDLGGSVYELPGGGYMIAGNSSSADGDVSGNHGGGDMWLIKIGPTGSLLWQKCYGGTGDDGIIDEGGSAPAQMTTDGGTIFSGWSNSTDGDVTGNHGSYDFWVVKASSTGSLVWEHSFGGTGDDQATTLQQTIDTGYIIAGTTYSNDGDVSGNHGGYDYWVAKLSPTGSLQWQKCLGGGGFSPGDCAKSIRQTLGGGYIVAGLTNANDGDVTGNHGDFDWWVVKLNCLMPDAGLISGPSALCLGATAVLTNTATTGTWSTQTGNTTMTTGGSVTGAHAGADTIKYMATNTCGASTTIHPITVNPLPAPVVMLTGPVLSTTVPFTTYQWLLAGTPIAGATNPTYTVPHTGMYSVIVTNAVGCTGTSAGMSIVPVSISNVSAMPVTISPNPTSGDIAVAGASKTAIKIYNTLGQLIKTASDTDHISIAELPAGMYYIKVYDAEGH